MTQRRIVLSGFFLLTACGPQLHIESDTSWEGAVGANSSYSIDGSANRIIDIDSGACWSIQKQTSAGSLRAYSKQRGLFGILGSTEGDATTTAEYGVVSGCDSGSQSY